MKRSAFTLVELLVVIAVIVLLAALLFPALNAARRAAYRTKCISNQKEIAIALIHYSQENGLPGYVHQDAEDMPAISWVVPLFLYMGEGKRYDDVMYQDPITKLYYDPDNLPPPGFKAIGTIPAFICPSDRPDEIGRINYVVNCGIAEDSVYTEPTYSKNGILIDGDDAPQFALFNDRRSAFTFNYQKIGGRKFGRKFIDEIIDGSNHTILLSENLDAGFWYKRKGLEYGWDYWTNPLGFPPIPTASGKVFTSDPPTSRIMRNAAGESTRDQDAVSQLGFVWSPNKNRVYAPNYLPSHLGTPRDPVPPPSSPLGPRPSSRHPGVVVVAYANGNVGVVSDDDSVITFPTSSRRGDWLEDVCPDDKKLRTMFKIPP